MIDIATETIVSLSAAAKKMLGRPHISTVHRWRRGLSDGRQLETIKIGGKVFTSIEACQRFAVNGSLTDEGPALVEVAVNEDIEQQLDEIGLH